MIVRPLRRADVERCVGILHANFHRFKESQGGYIPDEIVQNRLVGKYTAEELFRRSQNGAYFVAEHDGIPVGLVGLNRPVDGKAEIVNFYLDPAHSRRGIGRKLFEHVLRHASEKGITRLFAYSVLNAHDAYEALGFRHLPEKDKYLRHEAPPGFNARFACSHASA
ncbi:MAG: GNAT family N-acetyltransferase, partial [Candidatus Micrarchaeota archaeon]|nr:GNAT family N-acetyltransferase [Candidatus Micrarchaeota archaeon]